MADRTAIDAALRLAHLSSRPPQDKQHIELPKSLNDRGVNFLGGLIHSPIAGRTDELAINIPSGSYVLPADVVSGLGQGNTIAGAALLDRVFAGNPYHAEGGAYRSRMPQQVTGGGPPGVHPGGPPAPPAAPSQQPAALPHRARGGRVMVPIIAAGGEYVVSPHHCAWLGDGDVKKGHDELDKFVVAARAKTKKTLHELPGPKK